MVPQPSPQAVKPDQPIESTTALDSPPEIFGLPPEQQPTQPEPDITLRESTPEDTKTIPYTRFKEVIDERNELRRQIGTAESSRQPDNTNKNDTLSDIELNSLWEQNPSLAAKTMFAQVLDNYCQLNNRKQDNYMQAMQKYPQLQNTNHELTIIARDIMQNEMPELKTNPDGILIASEMAAARFYKDQYERIAKQNGMSMKNLQANRSANLKGAFIEHSNNPSNRIYHDCLSDEEQKVAKMMGVPVESYLEQKTKKHNLGGRI